MGRRRTACETCAAIKTVCSKEVPCARCKRLSLQCSLGNSSAAGARRTSHLHAAANDRNTRQQHSKSSGGCTNCKARRKKCDERQPTCGDCVRLGLHCIRRRVSLSLRADGSSPSSDREVRVSDFSTADSASESQYFDWISVVHEEYLTDSARVSNLANSSALEVLPDAQASDDSPPSDGVSFPSTALANLAGITHGALRDWTTGERHLLNHFLQSVARTLVVVNDRDNPFLSDIVPMALESPLVRHALTALSACHLAKIYPDFERNLFLHRSRALEELKTELKDHRTVTWALAATLLLCLSEICAGDSRKWLLYLHGGKALLANVSAGEVLTPSIEFLIELYNYLCCMASVTSKNVPQPFGPTLKLGVSRAGGAIHPLFGIAVDIYECLVRINRLASTSAGESHQDSEIKTEGEAIELRLQSWVPPENSDEKLMGMSEARAAAFAMQWAAMLRLRQLMPLANIDSRDAHYKGPTEHIISAVSLIRPGSQTESRLLYPLFMAGTTCMTKASRLTIEYRINIMERTVGFGNTDVAHQLLDEIWRQYNRGEVVQWDQLVASRAPGLVLF